MNGIEITLRLSSGARSALLLLKSEAFWQTFRRHVSIGLKITLTKSQKTYVSWTHLKTFLSWKMGLWAANKRLKCEKLSPSTLDLVKRAVMMRSANQCAPTKVRLLRRLVFRTLLKPPLSFKLIDITSKFSSVCETQRNQNRRAGCVVASVWFCKEQWQATVLLT